MNKSYYILFLVLFHCVVSLAQSDRHVQKIDTVLLWPNGAPNSFEIPEKDSGFITFRVKDYETALLEVYPSENPNGLCVIMCPGGAYIMESQEFEGRDLKDWFITHGVTYCMLQYRLPCGHHDVPLSDVQQAIRIMKERSSEFGIKKICIAGNSAGGHVAACASTMFESSETRPDYQLLMYPVITMESQFTNMLSRNSLLGHNPSQELIDMYSCEKNVSDSTPPAFIVLCSDDDVVHPSNSLMYYEQLLAHNVSATMHIYPHGGHGWGWKDTMRFKNEWTDELEAWLHYIMKDL